MYLIPMWVYSMCIIVHCVMSGYLTVDTSLPMTLQSLTLARYCARLSGFLHSNVSWPGASSPESHAQWSILARGGMYSEVSWPEESCTLRYPGPGSHAHRGIWARESCTARYPGLGSHAQRGILAFVIYSCHINCCEADYVHLFLHDITPLFVNCNRVNI